MKVEIKHWNGKVIFGGEYATVLACLLAAVAAGTDLRGANLCGTDLRGANLRGANLRGAGLRGTDLCGANLRGANLRGTNLRGANLRGANLRGANLRGANLRGTDLYGANLYGADLRGANLCGTDLRGANLRGVWLGEKLEEQLWFVQTRILSDGGLIGWKKCRSGVIVKLLIPEAAKRSHAFGRKCRAEYAEVLEVIGGEVGISQHDGKTEYRVGETVRPDSFDPDWRNECAPGVHFYITRVEAENH